MASATSASSSKQPRPQKPEVQPLPSSFSQAQAKKAVDALLKHNTKVQAEKEDTELLPREEYVYLVVNTKSGSTKKKVKPVKIVLPHPPLPPPPATSVCLLTKDPQRQYKDLLAAPENNIKFINRVVGVSKLKGKFKPYEARRQLMRDHELFLCDDRILEKMPALLGKMFFDAKKQPISVNLRHKDLKGELGRAISSTYFHPSTGTSFSIRIATPSSSTSAQTLENLLAAVPPVIAQIPDQWSNILSVGIKTSTSVLLPIWNSPLDGRFKGVEDVDGDVEMGATESKKSVDKPVAAEKKEKAAEKAVKPAKSVLAETKKVAGKVEKGDKKKTSTIGKGGAGKRAKQSVIGTA